MRSNDLRGALMTRRSNAAFFVLFVTVVAPLGAAVIVAALLLFGMHPRAVFAPGWALLSFLQSRHVHAPNAVGVAATTALWWLLIVVLGVAWDRRRSRVA